MAKEILIPYVPRGAQAEIHPEIEKHRFNVLVIHRRFGKTVLTVNHIIKMALQNKLPNARYAYMAPFLKQAKLIAWDYFKKYTAPIPNVKINESELTVDLPNGARIYLFGADNPDALRGTYLDGAVLDEYGQMKSETFSEIIRPALTDRNGWAVFCGTPKGQNQFLDIYNLARKMVEEANNQWWCCLYRASDTGVINDDELAQLQMTSADSTYRQEFLCDFTSASDNVLITIDAVTAAQRRNYSDDDLKYSPTIIGVDVARYGADRSVIQIRCGLKMYEPQVYRGVDNMTMAGYVSEAINRWNPDAVFIDAGRGEGVIDRLRQLNYNVTEVNFGGRPINDMYNNKRTEMWDLMKKWIDDGGQLPLNRDLTADLVTPTYDFDAANRMRLESKDKIKDRLGKSPDIADSGALTFAMPVISRSDRERINKMPKMALR